jgi:hypothetical protein
MNIIIKGKKYVVKKIRGLKRPKKSQASAVAPAVKVVYIKEG